MTTTQRVRGVHKSQRRGWWVALKETFWPSMGWGAFFRYVLLTLKRQAKDPHQIALGVALGVGLSFLPLPGMGMILSAAAAWMFRASIAAAVVGQWVGNPWTFPLILWSTFEVGKRVWPLSGGMKLDVLMQNLNWGFMIAHSEDVLVGMVIPMFLGGIILGTVFGIVSYMVVQYEVAKFLEFRKKRRGLRKKHD